MRLREARSHALCLRARILVLLTPKSPHSLPISLQASKESLPKVDLLLWERLDWITVLAAWEDILSQGNVEVRGNIFLQTTAIEVCSHTQTDWLHGPQNTFFRCPVFLWSKHSGFRKWANYTWNLSLSTILIQSNPCIRLI